MSGSPEAPPSRSPSLYRVAWFFYLVLAVAGLVWLGAREGRIGLSLFVVAGSWWLDLALGLGAAALLLALWWMLERLSAEARDLEAELSRLVAGLTRGEGLALALISALAEELFFRGALQGAVGLLPAAFLFALLHGGPGKSFRLWALFALLAALVLGVLVRERGALGSAIVAHAAVNALQLARLSRKNAADAPV